MFPRWLRLILAILVCCALAGALFVFVPLYRSLPDRGGRFIFPGIANVSALQRDQDGIVRISAHNRRDAGKLLGFAHAQDRFFQMDLLRRTAAGELAELFGPTALPVDRENRRHRLRATARAALNALPEPTREVVEGYALGVNLGLNQLETVPFEYLLLRAEPARWKSEDSLLVVGAMALLLQRTDGEPELSRAVVGDVFDPATAAFLLSAADDFQAALDGTELPLPTLPATPGYNPALADLPAQAQPAAPAADAGTNLDSRLFAAWAARIRPASSEAAGSNAFAVRGQSGEAAVALLANDIHLPLALPNTWYRAEIVWSVTPRTYRTIDGITLPGLPFLIAGSNSQVAWGFTNAFADTVDLVVLETDPANPGRYRTPDGWRDLERITETIAVKGAAPEAYTFDSTIWGPVLGTDHRGRRLALRWAMADAGAYDLGFSELEQLGSARAALAFAKKAGMPQLNIVVADREGDIGWTVAGHLPRRVGLDGSHPVSWADGTARWDGWLPLDHHPQVFNPPSGRLWSANNRMVGGDDLALLGDGGYQSGARATRLRDRLAELEQFSPEALLDIQLDVRGLYLDRWQALLVATLDSAATTGNAGRAELRALAENWGGEAVPESAGYRLVHDFRAAVLRRVDTIVFARCRAAFPRFDASSLPLDRIAATLARQQPAGWHPAGSEGWKQLLLDAADATTTAAGGPGRLARHTWGEANRLAMSHPLGAAFPWIGYFLNMPATPLPGDPMVVRAQAPSFGAAARMVIRPGWEKGSLLQMPGGQCANPLSPHYSDGHSAWVKGEPTPLRPGKIENYQVHAPPEKD